MSQLFSDDEISKLREAWGTIVRIDPAVDPYKKLIAFLDGLPQARLKQLSEARIQIVSRLAYNRIKQDTWEEAFSLPRKKKRKSQIGRQREIMFGSRRFIYEQETSRQWSGYFDDNHAVTHVERTKRELLEDAMSYACEQDIELKGGDIEIRAADRVLS